MRKIGNGNVCTHALKGMSRVVDGVFRIVEGVCSGWQGVF